MRRALTTAGAAGVVLCLGLPPALPAATLVVSNSITEAAALAQPGDTLLARGPAVFHEQVRISKPLRLLGVNHPVIDGGGLGSPLTLAAAQAQVIGFTIRGGGNDLGNFDSGIMVTAPEVVVRDNTVAGCGFGIYLRGASGCRIENNCVLGNTNLPPAQRGNGIHLWKTRDNVIAGNTIRFARDGAYFSYADQNLIATNHIEQTRFGIHYMYSHRNRLFGNTLTGNAVGAALMFARDCEVADNSAIGNRRHGILLKQVERSNFLRNVARGQNRGFFVQQASQCRFEDNVLEQNDIGLYLSNGSEQNVFVGNAFLGNADQVWQPQDEVELGRLASNQFYERGRGNFWSDYVGADANRDGLGDTPYHETTLYGYLVDRHPEARVFALSPAAALLRRGEELLPLLNTHGVTDPFPLMQPGRSRPAAEAAESLAAAACRGNCPP